MILKLFYTKYMQQRIILSPTLSIPIIGFGTYKLTGEICQNAVSNALEMGYRHIDAADLYGNHHQVGVAIKKSGIKREDIFLTSKVWRDKLHTEDVLTSAQRFLDELQTDYIDLLLVHWPNNDIPITETLGAMQELQQQKVIKAIGVSNFTIPLLQEALATHIPFVMNQVEFHPSLYQKNLKTFCDEQHIAVTAYSPIARGKDLEISLIQELATKYHKTASQIALNWLMKKNIVVIPRTAKLERSKENLAALSFELSNEDSARIDALDLHTRFTRPEFAPFTD